ncbi:MAG: hypothetical protein HC819_10320 [Cyclobacteriaceae bacterium]|nr:hypothetical protein [Cyclobacteriaceae bacterium]
MKPTLFCFGILLFICYAPSLIAQTASIKENPKWNLASDWTLGVPLNGGKTTQNVDIKHNSAINFDLEIKNTVTISASHTFSSSREIKIGKGGKLIVYGKLIMNNEDMEMKDGGMLIVKDGGEVEGCAKCEIKAFDDGLAIESGGEMLWKGEMVLEDQNSTYTIDGKLSINEFKNKAVVTGNGTVEVVEKWTTVGSYSIAIAKNVANNTHACSRV